jgi:prophage regulatory protein
MGRITERERKRGAAQSAKAIKAREPQADRLRVIAPRVLRCPEVQLVTGLGRTTIYEQMAAGKFPRPIQITDKFVAWVEPEIIAWQRARIAQRDGTN